MQIYGLRQRLPGRRLPRSAAGWIGANNAFDRLVRYLHTCVKYLISYGARWGQGQPFTSAGAESVVDCVNGQGLKRNGHMQWTRPGANAILQVRCAVFNGQDIKDFLRWYPPRRRIPNHAPASLTAQI